MNQKGENLAAVVLVLLVIANVVGIAIPVWYHKEHEHMVNSTVEKSSCVVHVNIREGLWQRKCIERRVEDCMLDVQGRSTKPLLHIGHFKACATIVDPDQPAHQCH
jgi:hypothetical protein